MTVFINTLKRIFVQPFSWAALLIFPVIFAILISITNGSGDQAADSSDINTLLFFGIVDQDNTALSAALVKQLDVRYNIIEMTEEDVSAKLTEQDVPWVLLVREGYESDLLAGREPVLEGYSLTVSDVSALGSATAANISHALMLLGTNDRQTISAWEDASHVNITVLEDEDNWEIIAFWFGFFGFISIYTAYFIVRTLMDNKRGGMPDRIGVLPQTPREHLLYGMLAAFAATELTVILVYAVTGILLGTLPNALYLLLLLSLYNLFTVGMVYAIFSLAKNTAVSSIAMTMLSTIIAMLGGLFWPLEFVPDFMQKLAWFSPGYWLSRGLSNIQEITFEGYGMPVLFLMGFTIVTLLLGGWKRIQALEE